MLDSMQKVYTSLDGRTFFVFIVSPQLAGLSFKKIVRILEL